MHTGMKGLLSPNQYLYSCHNENSVISFVPVHISHSLDGPVSSGHVFDTMTLEIEQLLSKVRLRSVSNIKPLIALVSVTVHTIFMY